MSSLSCPPLCSLLLLLLPLLPTVFTFTQNDCQKVPTSLLAQDESSPWMSNSGDFALVFHPVDDQKHFLFAVWFNKVKDQTIVWSANGNEPAPPLSEFKLDSNGEFILSDPDGKELWRAQTNSYISACVVILDTGNFVILNESYDPIWESFGRPTDTILPSQTLRIPTSLKPQRSKTYYSLGHFQLNLQADGNLVLFLFLVQNDKFFRAYLETSTLNWKSQLILDEGGSIYIKDEIISSIHNITQDENSSPMFYYMARLDYNGIFGLYKHPRSDESYNLSWTLVQEIPDDICVSFQVDGNGGGWCGYYGICQKNDRISNCTCPPRYTFLNESDPAKGCKPDFPLPTGQTDGWETNKELVDFRELPNTNWPYADYNVYSGVKADQGSCQQLCIDDWFCAAFTYFNHTCWLKRHPLIHGVRNQTIKETAVLKVPKGEAQNKKDQFKNKKDQSALVLVMAVLLGNYCFLNILLLVAVSAALFFINQQKRSLTDVASTSAMSIRRYTYKELEKATGGFRQILGSGVSGKVDKGILTLDHKRFVAVKKLVDIAEEGEKEFKVEVSAICQTHHKNLVRLVGYCDEDRHRLLVYEYMSNGSLATFLFVGFSRPHWDKRVQIAFGIARGLMYLHEECNIQLIHCEIKLQNILLDDNFTLSISDFGLAKLFLTNKAKSKPKKEVQLGILHQNGLKKHQFQ